jgi:hypothetical protein
MDVSTGSELTVGLKDHFVLSKRAAGADFLVTPAAGPAVAERAAAWLQNLLHSANLQSTIILCDDGEQWMLHASRATRLDASGRGDALLHGARLTRRLPLTALPDLLLYAHQNGLPAQESLPSEDKPAVLVTGTSAPWSPQLLVAALAIATGADRLPAVAQVAEATRLVSLFDDDLVPPVLDFLCLLPRELGGQLPPGRGIAVSQALWQCPPQIAALSARAPDPTTLDLSGLARLPDTTERRLALLAAILDPDCLLPSPLEAAELHWVLARGVRRVEALRGATGGDLADLLVQGALFGADLPRLTEAQLAALDPIRAARLFQGETDALARFVALFGPSCAGSEALLPPSTARLLEWLRSGNDRPDAPSPNEAVLTALDQVGALDLGALSKLHSTYVTAPTAARFGSALLAAGLPAPVVAGLLTDQTPATAPELPPRLAPAAHWLRGIPPPHLIGAGAWACSDQHWRDWWVQALGVHPGIADGSVAGLDGDWSEARQFWLLGALQDGELAPAAVLAWLARVRGRLLAGGRTGPILSILAGCRIPDTPWLSGYA